MRLIGDHLVGVVTVYGEAEGEPYKDKVMVAEVILNRTRSKYSSDGTVTGTCLRALQFSCHNANSPNRIRMWQITDDNESVKDCLRAWDEAIAGSDLAHGALLYFRPLPAQKTPEWVDSSEMVAKGTHHLFYKPCT
jgi:spore germination cell wall hydrolase CwlJ-like protein